MIVQPSLDKLVCCFYENSDPQLVRLMETLPGFQGTILAVLYNLAGKNAPSPEALKHEITIVATGDPIFRGMNQFKVFDSFIHKGVEICIQASRIKICRPDSAPALLDAIFEGLEKCLVMQEL